MAVRTWELHLEGCRSLKEKRSVLKPLLAALGRGNVSVAETAHQDRWQRAEVACAAVGSDRTVVEALLRDADRTVEGADGVRILDTATMYR